MDFYQAKQQCGFKKRYSTQYGVARIMLVMLEKCKNTKAFDCLSHKLWMPKLHTWVRVSQIGSTGGLGDSLGKMAKSCTKMTKSLFLGQNSEGDMGGQANFSGSEGGGDPLQSPPPSTRGNPVDELHQIRRYTTRPHDGPVN